MHKLSSSLRATSIAETLAHAKELAPKLGITRVTDTTQLDRIGIPVFASIRPKAQQGSLCVNAGKGVYTEEAMIGAYMEAIEFAKAEYGKSDLELFTSTPRKVAQSLGNNYCFVDFCPSFGIKVQPDSAISCIEAEDIGTGKKILVPAELAFIPFHENHSQQLFGTSTNGLCSGNNVLEASIHGLSEVMERDVQAFDYIDDKSQFVSLKFECPIIQSLITKVVSADLTLSLRYTQNQFKMPYFRAYILEKSDEAPISIACGSALHPLKTVAIIRAICEAAQSRLSHIHGGRDDIIDRVKFFKKHGRNLEISGIEQLRNKANDTKDSILFSEIQDYQNRISNLDDAWDILIESLNSSGIRKILRVAFTKENESLQVLKIIVPKLESFEANLKRVGPRLRDYVKAKK